ncbi:MFS transporter [Falsiroseomonas sp.]|uniref:MFS transporter n=1 Tax=Falsiroseomonas sp. TaxID=2870721 RepID=UPI00356862FA
MGTVREGGKARHLAVLCLAVVLSLSVWFAGTAAVPDLLAEGLVTSGRAGWLTMAVQLGFVVGTLVSAVLSLADRRDPRLLFLACGLLASAATLAQTLVAPSGVAALLLRFVAGAAMAGVYPVGMKLAASWAEGDLGLLIGLLVGAVTLGSALPHLAPTLLGGIGWQAAYLGAGVLAAAGGVAILAFRPGPLLGARPPFRPSQALEAWRNKGLRLANLGYLGHMWELYAMWAWIGLFLAGVLGGAPGQAGPWVFAVLGAGAVGCVLAGVLADRWDRAAVASLCMLASGACAVLIGPAAALGPLVVLAIALLWGFTVVADSAQFSACIVSLSPPDYVGTMLTVQTSLGFLLTAVTIGVVPMAVGWLGWDWAFAVLAPGPFLGAWAMWRLRPLLPRAG